jgi:hypothetical protein
MWLVREATQILDRLGGGYRFVAKPNGPDTRTRGGLPRT